MVLDINLLLLLHLPDEKALKYRFGLGFTLSSMTDTWRINTGLTLLWFIGKYFYFETGADLVYKIYENYETGVGVLRPFIGIGWRF
jgi:hypothetical protein